MHVVRSTCRACDSSDLALIVACGEMPLAGALRTPAQLIQPEETYPLDLAFCRRCALLQLIETVSPSLVYDDDYRHYASLSVQAEESQRTAAELIETRGLDNDSLVIEIGSNDGYLLRHFHRRRIPVLGIEPAPGPSQVARQAGIPTLATFFTSELSRYLQGEGRRADLLIANDVLGRVPDMHGFITGMRGVLKDDGIVVLEVPDARSLVTGARFDEVYHEHLSYFSATSLDRLLRSDGLFINDVEVLPEVNGGRLRFYAGLQDAPSASVGAYLQEEARAGVSRLAFYRDFPMRVDTIKGDLRLLLEGLIAAGQRIAGFGAGANASALLNKTDIDERYLSYVVDPSFHRQGRFMPGVHLAVLPPERLRDDPTDYILLLDTTQRESMLQHLADAGSSARIILPFPQPAVL